MIEAIIALSIALAIALVSILVLKIGNLTISAYTFKINKPPTDADIRECQEYVIKRLLGQKPKL